MQGRCNESARREPDTHLQPPTSHLQPRTSNLPPPTSNLPPPTSNLRPGISHLPHPTSNLLTASLSDAPRCLWHLHAVPAGTVRRRRGC
jgi:hypothetical protein